MEREWRAGDTGLVANPAVNGDDRTLDVADLAAPFEDRHGVAIVPGQNDPLVLESLTLGELLTNPSLSSLSAPEREQIASRGVVGAIQYLRNRADRLDDRIDAGFLRFQSDTYRLRQMVLDATEASRLLVSPALAGIATAETASISQAQLGRYLKALKASPSATSTSSERDSSDGDSENRPGRPSRARPGTLAPPARGVTLFNTTRSSRRSTGLSGFKRTLAERGLPSTASPDRGSSRSRSDRIRLKPLVKEERSIGLIRGKRVKFSPKDISRANALVGKPFIRTTRIAKRIRDPRGLEVHDHALVTRQGVVLDMSRLARDLAIEDGQDPDSEACQFPGFLETLRVQGFEGEMFLSAPHGGRLLRFAGPERHNLIQSLLERQSASATTVDESVLFGATAEIGEQTVGLLRQIEGVVQRYRDAIEACETALELLNDQLGSLRLRLGASEERLAEARHDVGVCRALIDEEEHRVAAINQRRSRILAEEVPFLAYRRPRVTDNRGEVPSRPLDPGLLDAPLPACQGHEGEIPEDLERMLSLLREAPAAWFGKGLDMARRINRMDRLLRVVATTRWRSRSDRWSETFPGDLSTLKPLPVTAPGTIGLERALQVLQHRQLSGLRRRRLASHRLDLQRLALATLLEAQEEIREMVSLGDLAEGEHGDASLAQQASSYLGEISRVAGCLHAEASELPAQLRLGWAELLSAFDRAPSLRNLSALDGFAGLAFATRHRLQGLTDWLFDQLATDQEEALDLINDLVRVCLLMASHAPVGRLIAGRLLRPVRARPGAMVPLKPVQAAPLHLGMEALLMKGNRVVARAVLEDVGREESRARLISLEGEDQDLGDDVRVQFTTARRSPGLHRGRF